MQKYKNYIYYTYYVKNCENNTGISFTSSCVSCHLMDVQYCAHQSTPHFFMFCLEESTSDSYRRETGRKGSGLSNYTRTGFKISNNSSYAEMNLNVKYCQYIQRYSSVCLQPFVKHGGGSVTVWHWISDSDSGDLVKIDKLINAEMYHQSLIRHAIPSEKQLLHFLA